MPQTADGSSCMNSLFFFDDWLLFAREGLDRRQGRPERIGQFALDPQADPDLESIRGLGIVHDPIGGGYEMVVDCQSRSGMRFFTRLRSDDPYRWPTQEWKSGSGPLWTRADNVYLDQHGRPLDCFNVLCLAGTPLAQKGYVATFFDYARTHRGDAHHSPQPSAAIGFSRDGLHFEVEAGNCYIPHHSDTSNPPIYNPWTGEFLIYCRPEQSDRRIGVVTTRDFRTFSPYETILQPDPLDPVGREFYGLTPWLQDDLFVGTLSIYDTEPTEKAHVRMQGINEMQLAYSYNGKNWYRASREMFLERGEPGTDSGGSIYAGMPVRTPANRLLFGTMVSWTEHGMDIEHCPEEWRRTPYRSYLYEMRPDGFVFLRTSARCGRLRTKAIVPQGGELTINALTTPSGHVKAVMLDAQTFEPIPNYTLDDAIPLVGDELTGTLRWRERKNLDELKDRRVMLELHVREADLYALRFPYRVHLGEYIRDRV